MLISIITPSFNSSKYIESTYQSIVSQTYSNWEWLVTDDCSTDNTYLLISQIAEKDSRVKIFRNQINSGAAISRNNSIENASGNFLAFIDSDDVWLPTKLDKQLSFMGEGIDFSFTAYALIDSDGASFKNVVDARQEGSFSYEDMLRKKATLGCSTVMLRVSGFDNISMPLIRTGQDYALWLKLLRSGKKAHVLASVLTQYRILPDSISRNKLKKAKRQWEIYRQIESLSLFKAIECFFYYALRATFRK